MRNTNSKVFLNSSYGGLLSSDVTMGNGLYSICYSSGKTEALVKIGSSIKYFSLISNDQPDTGRESAEGRQRPCVVFA